MTTIEIVLARIDLTACREGKTFAEAHPDPREAVTAALASKPQDGRPDTSEWHFLRWAVLCLDEDFYNLGNDLDSEAHAMMCGEYLQAWLDREYPVS